MLDWHGAASFRNPVDGALARERIALKANDVFATSVFSNGIIPGKGAITTYGPLWSLSTEIWRYCLALLQLLLVGSDRVGTGAYSRCLCTGKSLFVASKPKIQRNLINRIS